jgi:hypothetical protein
MYLHCELLYGLFLAVPLFGLYDNSIECRGFSRIALPAIDADFAIRGVSENVTIFQFPVGFGSEHPGRITAHDEIRERGCPLYPAAACPTGAGNDMRKASPPRLFAQSPPPAG